MQLLNKAILKKCLAHTKKKNAVRFVMAVVSRLCDGFCCLKGTELQSVLSLMAVDSPKSKLPWIQVTG